MSVALLLEDGGGWRKISGEIVPVVSPTVVGEEAEAHWREFLKGEEDEGNDWVKFFAQLQVGYRRFALRAEGMLQGLIIISETVDLRAPENADTQGCGVAYLSTAPWNRPWVRARMGVTSPPRIKFVGSQLMGRAIEESISLGHGGGLGWHSVNGAQLGYRKMFPNLFDLGPDWDANGMHWFEIDARIAKKYIENLCPSIILTVTPSRRGDDE